MKRTIIPIAIVLAVLVWLTRDSSIAREASNVGKLEYQTLVFSTDAINSAALSELGRQGWRVKFVTQAGTDQIVYTLARSR